jgi:Arc/MetJ family transcription regulator
MRTTLNIDDDLLAKASESTGIKEKTALVRLALQRLVEAEAYQRLAALGGTMPNLKIPPRRRSEPARR